jgi:catechol 2,3-dioxygenase-like lactoylglutathione lyase family enzyme
MRVRRILRFSRPVADPARAAAFYQAALGFVPAAEGLLRLGGEAVALQRATVPANSGRSSDLGFQHLAVVVRDMDAAYAHLAAVPAWQPISRGGPVLLPPDSGGVWAFKFRDPDGNPLELISFPPGTGRTVWQRQGAALFLGIDHSALCVADTARSIAFYAGLGFRETGRRFNHGPAQARLDGLADARVAVIALRPDGDDGPGLELLAYRPPGRPADPQAPHDLVTLSVDGAAPVPLRDPDGHQFAIVPTTLEEASG